MISKNLAKNILLKKFRLVHVLNNFEWKIWANYCKLIILAFLPIWCLKKDRSNDFASIPWNIFLLSCIWTCVPDLNSIDLVSYIINCSFLVLTINLLYGLVLVWIAFIDQGISRNRAKTWTFILPFSCHTLDVWMKC